MKFRKADGSAIEIDLGATPPYVPVDEAPPPVLLEMLDEGERTQLLQWLAEVALPKSLKVLDWPGWRGAFSRRHALFKASWTSVGELVDRLKAAAGGGAAGS